MLDGRNVWWDAGRAAAEKFGYGVLRVHGGEDLSHLAGAVGFVRPTAEPVGLKAHQAAYHAMRESGLQMVQDDKQIDWYDDKISQWKEWHSWMPESWLFTEKAVAMAFLRCAPYPLVSKAREGASSTNVRILRNEREAMRHVAEIFGRGVVVHHCAAGARSRQKGYVFFQRFVPHDVTWRVNAIGSGRAVFRRFNYSKARPVAQTGNVAPVMQMDATIESLLDFADKFFTEADTGWCALDVLQEGDGWTILETSLAWPWNVKDYSDTPIFRTPYQWGSLWEAMFHEIEEGRLAVASSPSTSL